MYPFGKRWRRSLPYVFLLPALAIYFLFFLGPSLATFVFSFTDISGIPHAPWKFIGFTNYSDIFHSGKTADMLAAGKRSIIFSLSVTLIQTFFGLFIAMILNGKLKGRLFYRSVIFMPVILGVTVTGLIWSLVFNPMDGPAQKLLHLFGGNSQFLGSYDHAFIIVIFVQIWMNMGYTVIIFLSGLQSIPKELYEAGTIDGTSAWQSFHSITWPMLAPAATVNILLAIVGSLQTFDVVYVLTKGNFYTSVIGMEIFKSAFQGGMRQGFSSALAIVQFMIVLVVALIFQSYLRRREVQM